MHTDRQKAIKAGHSRYLGNPCRYGHNGERYTLTRNCCACETERKRNERQTVREARDKAKRSGGDDG